MDAFETLGVVHHALLRRVGADCTAGDLGVGGCGVTGWYGGRGLHRIPAATKPEKTAALA